jgi:hypothetical protein
MFGFGKKKKQEKIRRLRGSFRWKYENLRNLLRRNCELLETLSDIQSHVGDAIPGNVFTHQQISDLLDGTLITVGILNNITGESYTKLYKIHRQIAGKIQESLWKAREEKAPPVLMPLETVDRSQQKNAGGKAAGIIFQN